MTSKEIIKFAKGVDEDNLRVVVFLILDELDRKEERIQKLENEAKITRGRI